MEISTGRVAGQVRKCRKDWRLMQMIQEFEKHQTPAARLDIEKSGSNTFRLATRSAVSNRVN